MLKKISMSLSGAVLMGFLIGHLMGNLQIFAGQALLNRYAAVLKSMGGFLWVARVALVGVAGIHIWTSIALTYENRIARPIDYARRDYLKASLASRTLIWSGATVLAFLAYHLMHFTFLKVHPQYAQLVDVMGQRDVYSMIVLSFRQPGISLVYIVSLFLLCFHLSHAIQSSFQSLGLTRPASRDALSIWAGRIAWLLFAGYASIPVAVLTGIVRLPPGVHLP